jgi:hypothetical protein
MKAGDDGQRLIRFDDEKQRVRESAQKSAAHILEHHRKLARILAHALNEHVYGLSKAPA